QQLGAENRRCRGEKQIAAALFKLLVGLESHIDLRAAIIQAHGVGIIDELIVEALPADKLKYSEFETRIADNSIAFDKASVNSNARNMVMFNVDSLRVALNADINAAIDEISVHQLDQSIGATLKREHALTHEIRENNAVRDGRIFE